MLDLTLGLVLLVAACAACGDSSGATVDIEGSLQPYPESLVASALGIEPDAVEQTVARDFLTSCMLEAGFQVDAARLLASNVRAPSHLLEEWQGLSDTEFAEQVGFGITRSGAASLTELPVSPLDEFIAELSPGEVDAFYVALLGRDTNGDGGCLAGASKAQAESQQQQERSLYFQHLGDIEGLIDQDPEQLELMGEWASCMSAKGYDYSTMSDARDAATERFSSWVRNEIGSVENLLEQEIRDAVASLECEALIRDRLIEVRQRVEMQWLQNNGLTP